MAITYSLAPIPKWYISDLAGRPLGGGFMYTYRSLDKTEFKFVYQNPSGSQVWTDPILFDENGSQGPFYWAVDSNALDETYYIEVYDSSGVLQWTIDDFFPPGEGGGVVSEALDLENLIANNVCWRNIGETETPIVSTATLLAPGANSGLTETSSNAGPNILFLKSDTLNTDQVRFIDFQLGSQPIPRDVAPAQYINYSCSTSIPGETFKCIQFPITSGVGSLSNRRVTISFWGRNNSGENEILLQWFQFFGDGTGASLPVITPIHTFALTGSWDKYTISHTVPNVSGKSIGACGNSGLFLRISYPLSAATNMDIAKPCLFLGEIVPEGTYETYDMIDAVINTPRTGHILQSFNVNAPLGYIPMNDGTIGIPGSGASTRANVDTFPLYNMLWNNVPSEIFAPVEPGGRGASAVDDFSSGKTLMLPRSLGRLLGAAGSGSGLTTRELGEYLGTQSISIDDMPAHTHTDPFTYARWVDTGINVQGGSDFAYQRQPLDLQTTGGSAPDGKMPPSSFVNFFIKL